MSNPTFINCDRLDLKPPEEDHIEFLQEGINHPQVRQYISKFRTPYTESRYRDELWPIDTDGDSVTLLAVPNTGEFADEQSESSNYIHWLSEMDMRTSASGFIQKRGETGTPSKPAPIFSSMDSKLFDYIVSQQPR